MPWLKQIVFVVVFFPGEYDSHSIRDDFRENEKPIDLFLLPSSIALNSIDDFLEREVPVLAD